MVRNIQQRLTRRAWLASSSLAALECAYLGAGALMSGCGDESTTGRRIRIETVVASDLPATHVVETSDGWLVTVTRAFIAVGDLVYLEGAPIARHPKFSLLPSAFAHPGHYRAGDVLGEAHVPTVVDLLGDEVSLGTTEAVTGDARSATLGFHDPNLGLPTPPDNAVALVEGVARRDGEEDRLFIAHAFATDVISSVSMLPEVDGCALEAGDFTADGVVTLEVHVALWLDQVDFAAVPVSDTPFELGADTPPRSAFIRGVKKAAAYSFIFERNTL